MVERLSGLSGVFGPLPAHLNRPPQSPIANTQPPPVSSSPELAERPRRAVGATSERPGRCVKAPAPTPTAPTQFDLLIQVPQPDKRAKVGTKYKMVKSDPVKCGPNPVDIDLEWEAFTEVIAEHANTTLAQLVVTSFEWRFMKPQNSPWTPLNSSNGYGVFTRQLTAKLLKDPSAIVLLQMSPPVPLRANANDFVSHYTLY